MSSVESGRKLNIFTFRKYAIAFLPLFFAVGTAGTIWKPTHDLFLGLFPFALLLSFAFLLVFTGEKHDWQSLILILLTAITGFIIEAAGVGTGKIFGRYVYGDTLGIKFLDTPLLIGINWAMLTIAATSLTGRLSVNPILKVILASLVMLAYDLLLEQVAGRLDMWHWENSVVPLQNYLAWFAVALLLNTLMRFSRVIADFRIALTVLLCHTLFLAALNVYFSLG